MAKHDGIWSGPLNPCSLTQLALMLPVQAVLRTGVGVKALRVYLRAATSCPKLQALAFLWLILDAAANVFTCIFHLTVTTATNACGEKVKSFL